MKWKKLFEGLSITFAITDMLLAGIIDVSTIKNKAQFDQFKTINLALHHTDSIPVHFRYTPNSDYGGVYYPWNDSIAIHEWHRESIVWVYEYENKASSLVLGVPSNVQHVHHELKHAFNKTQFEDLNTHSDEVSARVASELFDKSLRYIFYEANQKLQSRMQTSDFIPKHNKISHAYQELEKIMQEVSGRFYPSKDTVIMMERDINYILPELSQSAVDEMLILGMHGWRKAKNLNIYEPLRKSDILKGNTFTSDTDLEKLFTFKINGVHRSLFKEASPSVRDRVRHMVNADDPADKVLRQLHVLGRG